MKVCSMNKKRPIGIFDSGMGGLTVVKEMQRILPNEDIVYFGELNHVLIQYLRNIMVFDNTYRFM